MSPINIPDWALIVIMTIPAILMVINQIFILKGWKHIAKNSKKINEELNRECDTYSVKTVAMILVGTLGIEKATLVAKMARSHEQGHDYWGEKLSYIRKRKIFK